MEELTVEDWIKKHKDYVFRPIPIKTVELSDNCTLEIYPHGTDLEAVSFRPQLDR